MIYRYFFPRTGWLKRYWHIRAQVMSFELSTPDSSPYPPTYILDFRNHQHDVEDALSTGNDTECWRISDDSVIGGYSHCTKAMIQTTECWSNHMRMMLDEKEKQKQREKDDEEATTKESEEEKKKESSQSSTDNHEQGGEEEGEETNNKNNNNKYLTVPYLRWSGHVDTAVPLDSRIQRSGFCHLKSPQYPFDGANLRGMYNCLEITCRSSHPRTYTFNLRVASTMPDDTYTGHIVFEEDDVYNKNNKTDADTNDNDDVDVDDEDYSTFRTFILPFTSFVCTARGRERFVNRKLDNQVQIENFAFLLNDGVTGDFCFDLARIRAVNYIEQDNGVFEGKRTDDNSTMNKPY